MTYVLPPDPVSIPKLCEMVPLTSPDASLWRVLLRELDERHPMPEQPAEGFESPDDYKLAYEQVSTRADAFHYAYVSFLRCQVLDLLRRDLEPRALARRGVVLQHVLGLPALALAERAAQLQSDQVDIDVAAATTIVFLLARCRQPAAVLAIASTIAEEDYRLNVAFDNADQAVPVVLPCVH